MLAIILFTAFSQVLAHVKIESHPLFARLKRLDRGSTIVDRDRARFQSLIMSKGQEKRAESVELKNMAFGYTMNVGLGSPPTYHNLAVDTGSSYTWIGPEKYVETSTSIKQGDKEFKARYARGWVTGAHYKDLLTLSPSLNIPDMEFGVASSINNIDPNIDGILGLGPVTRSRDIVTPSNGELVPGIVDNLFTQEKIQHNAFGMSFAPTTSQGVINGRLTFGETDPASYTGELKWVRIKKKNSEYLHWSFEQSIRYGRLELQPISVGYLDSGSSAMTLIYIMPGAFRVYSQSLPGSRVDRSNGLLEIPNESVGKMKSLSFVINRVSYELTPNAQLWPRALNHLISGRADAHYSVICSLDDLAAEAGTGFVIGSAFMQRFYTAYDASNSKIGFAYTPSTYLAVN